MRNTNLHPPRSTLNLALISVMIIGVVLRLLIVFGVEWMNDADLRNYYWAAQQAVIGNNPYRLWSQNLSGPRSDLLPLELMLLAFAVRIGQAPIAIRLLFVVVDTAVLWSLFWLYLDRPLQQLLWVALYAISPGTLYFFTMTPSDKPFILLVFILILLFQEKWKNRWFSCYPSLLTGLLGAFKWFGLFFAVPVAWESSRKRILRFFGYIAVIGGIFFLGHIPWFPDWAVVYRFRSMRFVEPFHTGIAVLLSHIGLPMVKLYHPLMILSWGTVTWLYLKGHLDAPSTMVLSVISLLIWAPDMTPQMLFLLTLMALVVVKWDTPLRAISVWIGTSWMTLMTAAAIGGWGQALLVPLKTISGAYGSISLVVWSHIMLGVSLYWLLQDRQR